MSNIFYNTAVSQVYAMINRHFPPELYKRFNVKMDIQVYKPGEDEGVWLRKKNDTQNIHIFFDGLELLEIPPHVPRKYVEVFILQSFRDNIASGKISVDRVLEWSDNATAKKNKKVKEEKKKKNIENAFKFARDNNFDVQAIESKLPPSGKNKKGKTVKTLKLKGR